MFEGGNTGNAKYYGVAVEFLTFVLALCCAMFEFFRKWICIDNLFFLCLTDCRKIPRDLTEASLSGAGLSIVAALAMVFLFGMVCSSQFLLCY